MVRDLLTVTPPKPPGSRTEISPPVAVLEIAPANVLHGAVRLHGSASLPTPDTHVRVACAKAGVPRNRDPTSTSAVRPKQTFISLLKQCAGERNTLAQVAHTVSRTLSICSAGVREFGRTRRA